MGIKYYVNLYFIALGWAAFAALLGCCVKPEILPLFPKIIGMIAIGSVPAITVNALILSRKGIDPAELWVRRIISSAYSTICYTITAKLLGLLKKYDTIEKLGIYIAVMIVVGVAASVTVFIVADRREKKLISKINEKLAENK